MCGIFGLLQYGRGRFSTAAREHAVSAMGKALAHRGPDGMGVHSAEHDGAAVTLGAGRLAIIDLAAPAGVITNEDGQIAVAFNGEIYNHAALRAQLEADGHRFRTRTDTEVIVHGYEAWGDAVLDRLRGMFAFALWDGHTGRALLARDGMGEKPLYLAETDAGWWFASEAKALFAAGALAPALDHDALAPYLVLGHTLPPDTLFAGVVRLAPGEQLVWQHGRAERRTYWRPTADPAAHMPYPDAVNAVRAALFETVRAQLVSDVPVGAFLSGGVDSTAVVAVMRALLDRPVNTFTVGFAAAPGSREDAKFNVDARYAREVAAAFGTAHHEIRIPNDARLAVLVPQLVYAQDDPIALPTIVQTAFVAALARTFGVPVLLNGEASDELFLGYTHYRADRVVERLAALPGGVRTLLGRVPAGRVRAAVRKAALAPADRYLDWLNIVSAAEAERMSAHPLAMARLRAWANDGLAGPRAPHFAERIAFTSLRGFVAEFNNMRVDKMCMAMSIEARSPFEDRAMVDLALSLPLAYKLRRGDFKRVLKDAVRDLVPAAVLTRPKWGFMPPASEWLRTSLRPLVETYLAPDRVAAVGVFRPDAIAALVSGHMERRSYALYPVWSALVFMLWHAFYIEGEPVPGGALTPEGVAAGAVIERGQATSPRARG